MTDLAKWGSEYEALKSTFNRIRVKGIYLTDEEQRRFLSECTGIAMSLKQISTSSTGIPASEFARREVLISNLEGQIRKSRTTTFRPENADTNANATFNPMELSGHGLVQHQKSTISMQDQMIEQIGSGVQRLHHQAQDIGEEAKAQNALLEAFSDNVDAGAEALREEAKHAEVVRSKTRMCKLYVCIGVEIAILCVLLMIYLNHGK